MTTTYIAQAADHLREAYVERWGKTSPITARFFESKAAELMELPTPPDLGPGGEVVRPHSAPPSATPIKPSPARSSIRDTLAQGATRVAEDASLRRTDLLAQRHLHVVETGIDAAQSISAANSLEKMLAHQAAAAHELAMRFADRALSYPENPQANIEANRCAHTSAKLMQAFQGAMLTLQKIRTGGTQLVKVEHQYVSVAPGGKALFGDVHTGGPVGRGSDGR